MKLRSFIPLTILFFLVLTGLIYGFITYLHPKVFTDKSSSEIQPITKDEKVVSCQSGDKSCEARNEKVKINQLSGTSVEYAKHQCDGPHACPTPEPEVATAAVDAIRSYAKDAKLELTEITGINPKNQIFYCATMNRCWIYNVKEKKATSYMQGEFQK